MSRLLVVDEEPKIREVIKEYAEFNGHEVTEATDGMSAVGLCKLNDYDLIILDIMMPKLDGFSTCKEIKKIKDIPTQIAHGRFDLNTRVISAYKLSEKLNNCELVIVEGVGHSPFTEKMSEVLIKFLEDIKEINNGR